MFGSIAAACIGSSSGSQGADGGTPLEVKRVIAPITAFEQRLAEQAAVAWAMLRRSSSASSSSAVHLAQLALLLSASGRHSVVLRCMAPANYWIGSSAFLVVLDTAAAAQRQHVEYVVDPGLRDCFTIARMSPAYQAVLDAVPEVFVGQPCCLAPLTALLSAEMEASFVAAGVTLPPWRQHPSLLARWFGDAHQDWPVPAAGTSADQQAAFIAAVCAMDAASRGRRRSRSGHGGDMDGTSASMSTSASSVSTPLRSQQGFAPSSQQAGHTPAPAPAMQRACFSEAGAAACPRGAPSTAEVMCAIRSACHAACHISIATPGSRSGTCCAGEAACPGHGGCAAEDACPGDSECLDSICYVTHTCDSWVVEGDADAQQGTDFFGSWGTDSAFGGAAGRSAFDGMAGASAFGNAAGPSGSLLPGGPPGPAQPDCGLQACLLGCSGAQLGAAAGTTSSAASSASTSGSGGGARPRSLLTARMAVMKHVPSAHDGQQSQSQPQKPEQRPAFAAAGAVRRLIPQCLLF